jgi:hypothetical protein
MTPNKMMLGREVNLPSELIFKNVREELFENEEQYVTSLRNNSQFWFCGYGGHISL